MIDLRPHRFWLGLLGAALALAFFNGPVLGLAQRQADARLAVLQSEHARAAGALHQLRDDIAETGRLENQIEASSVEKFLAPADRLRAAQIMERRALETRLSHFSYTLSPEQQVAFDTVGSGRQILARSRLTLAADAATDNDVYIFLDALRRALPGRFQLRSFALTRIGEPGAPLGAANLHVAATGDWLCNGAPRSPAEGSP